MVSESGLINDPNPEVCMINKVNFYMIITKVNTKKTVQGTRLTKLDRWIMTNLADFIAYSVTLEAILPQEASKVPKIYRKQ